MGNSASPWRARLRSGSLRPRCTVFPGQRFIGVKRHQRAGLILREFLADFACGF